MGWLLTNQQATGTVVDKEHRSAAPGYSTQIVANRTLVVPQATPEAYVLRVDIGGVRSETLVDKTLYDAIAPSERVRVTFQQRRLTGAVQIAAVGR